jgi:hypothetical protein
MASISAFKLRNNAGFVCAGQVEYIDPDGGAGRTGSWGRIALGQEEMMNIGDKGVPPGSWVRLYIDVVAGDDRTGSPYFTFDPSSHNYAEYDITGTTYHSAVHFDGVKEN